MDSITTHERGQDRAPPRYDFGSAADLFEKETERFGKTVCGVSDFTKEIGPNIVEPAGKTHGFFF